MTQAIQKHEGMALNPIVGSPVEKIEVFRQIAAALAKSGLSINGWENADQILAACWAADNLLIHPYAYMQGNWMMTMGGKKVIDPKWDFIIGLLKSRIPGFRWKVVEESPTRAEVWMTDGQDEHNVVYTAEDAKRQGLTKNALYQTSSREMLLKQAIKRCGRRVGPHILSGLPAFDFDDQAPDALPAASGSNGKKEPSTAEVLENAAEAAGVVEKKSDPEPAKKAESEQGPRTRLVELVKAKWGKGGKMTPAEVLQRISQISSECMPAGTVYGKLNEVGPIDARKMIEYLEKQSVGGAEDRADGKVSGTAPEASSEKGADASAPAESSNQACSFEGCEAEATQMDGDGAAWCDEHMPAPADEVALDEDEETPVEQQGAAAGVDQDRTLAVLIPHLDAYSKKIGKAAYKSAPWSGAPAGSTTYWIHNTEIQKAHGFSGGLRAWLKLASGELQQLIDPEMNARYVRWMREQGVVA